MDTAKVLGHEYRPRVIDATLQRALAAYGAVVIEGPRTTGKTMTTMHAAGSFVFVDDPEIQTVLDVAPRSLLDGAAPRLLGEWQVAPELWNLVRRVVDAAVPENRRTRSAPGPHEPENPRTSTRAIHPCPPRSGPLQTS